MFPLRNSLPFITELAFVSCSEEVIFEEPILARSLTAVTSLSFIHCDKLQSLPTELLHCLPSLKEANCFPPPPTPPPPKQDASLLKELLIYSCPKLRSLPEIGLSPFLKTLEICNCPKIQPMPEDGLPMSLDQFICSGVVHPTLMKHYKKFVADKYRQES
ncbi:hypothetical protein ZIOFF_000256 [Zingiber officinale]|uniref:Disease resistance protein n=1 Tax=Zingiber officinale TaxID=94328 RepID=A0A8J5LXT5_ZINOF|nr:hypothetical protein ZIOFF_000256 [Zingiber officinale]